MMDMTSPSSYLFNDKFYLEQGLQEYSLLNRVGVTDSEVTIDSIVLKSTETDTLVEVTLATHIYSLHENSNGDKYLKQSRQLPGEPFKDISLEVVTELRPNSRTTVGFDPVSLECAIFVEKTVLSWFDDGFSPEANQRVKGAMLFAPNDYSANERLDKIIRQLYFPALKDVSFLINEEKINHDGFKIHLHTLHTLNPDVGEALRENTSYEGFIKDICHPTAVQTVEDVELIKKYPRELTPIAMMSLGCSVSSLCKDDEITPLYVFGSMSFRGSFTSLDSDFIRFMFQHLPSESKPSAISVILQLTKAFLEMDTTNYVGKGENPSLNPLWDKIPSNLYPKLAEELLACLKQVQENLQDKPDSLILGGASEWEARFATPLAARFNNWFYQEILEPQVSSSKVTLSSLENRFLELFGIPLQAESGGSPNSIRILSKEGRTPLVSFSEFYTGTVGTYYEIGSVLIDGDIFVHDLFSNLRKLVTINHPLGIESGCDVASFEPYSFESRNPLWVVSKMYSLDDLMFILEAGAAVTDNHLTTLGREVTPQNRTAFLTWGTEMRGLKSWWKYFDLGVTDPDKIFLMKMCKVTDKTSIKLYNALPDEMFEEIICLRLPSTDEEIDALANIVGAYDADIEDIDWHSHRLTRPEESLWKGHRSYRR